MKYQVKSFTNMRCFMLLMSLLPFGLAVYAADTMDKSVTYNNQTEKDLILEAVGFYTKGKIDEALSSYSKAIKLNQERSPAYGARALIYAEKGNYDQAILDFNKAITISSTDFEAHYGRALSYSYKQDYENALIGFYQALKLNPKWADAYYDIGLIYQTQGNISEAISSYSKAIEIRPSTAIKSYINRATIYNELGKPDKALTDMNKAAIINPKDYRIYYTRAISYFYMKEYDKSWSDLRKIDELGATVPLILRQELEKASRKNR